MTDQQPRDPVGRYAEYERTQPEVSLPNPSQPLEGSFLFPPLHWPGGVTQYIDFWQRVPIADETLANLANAYAYATDEYVAEHMAQFARWLDNSPEALAFLATKPSRSQIETWRNGKLKERQEEVERKRSTRMRADVVRYVARAAQMHSNYSRLPAEDQRRVDDTVVYTTHEGTTWTVGQLWTYWRLEDMMPDALVDPNFGSKTDSFRIRQALEKLSKS